jgi:hypothetical protein
MNESYLAGRGRGRGRVLYTVFLWGPANFKSSRRGILNHPAFLPPPPPPPSFSTNHHLLRGGRTEENLWSDEVAVACSRFAAFCSSGAGEILRRRKTGSGGTLSSGSGRMRQLFLFSDPSCPKGIDQPKRDWPRSDIERVIACDAASLGCWASLDCVDNRADCESIGRIQPISILM